jgi:hypothetical protein
MFDTFNGLPLHPLVVHGVVVLLPLAVLGTILISVRPRWRTRYGLLVVATALAGTVMIPVATSSGEALEESVGDPGEHAELGDQLLYFALALLAAVAVLVLLQWRSERSGLGSSSSGAAATSAAPASVRTAGRVTTAAAAGAVVASLACGVQVYRVGDSGARAAWGDAAAASRAG